MSANGQPSSALHTLTEAAALSGRSPDSLRKLAARGRIGSKRNNSGRLLVEVPSWLLTAGQNARTRPDTVADDDRAELRTLLVRTEAERDRLSSELVSMRAERDRARLEAAEVASQHG